MSDHVSLGDLIRQQRAALGLTQARLAELVGKSPSTIRSWERDRSRPADDASLSALAAVLGLSEGQVQLAMWTETAEKADLPSSTLPGPSVPATVPEAAPADDTSIPEDEPEPDVSDPVQVEPSEVGEPTQDVESAEISPATEENLVEVPAATVGQSEMETVVSNEFFSPPSKPTSDRRFRLSDLADVLRSTSAVSSRPRVPSYLDDPTEIRTYRLRTILTAALLVFMAIVLLWAVGEAREAFSLIY